MNIQERIEALETEFNEKIKTLKAEAQQGDEFPQCGDEYWYIDNDGVVMEMEWKGNEYDQGRLSIGNVFRTKEQAEFAVEKLKVEAELRKYSRPFETGELNYYISYDTEDEELLTETSKFSKAQGAIYFEDEGKITEAIGEVGVYRIMKYIFGWRTNDETPRH